MDIDWNDLIGQWVQILKDGGIVRTGYVEDVTHAADALWLQGHGAEPRRLFLKADGFTAKAISEVRGQNR
ncbi:hypothetical protein AAIH25_03325 [Arthrobacter crystallopoietes]|uniref:hypothetical protein n=1 Tax=Crystallibacter crystallopoietes TaxID=37928 RepID=UPI003D1B07B5